jgi:hypothetical protein
MLIRLEHQEQPVAQEQAAERAERAEAELLLSRNIISRRIYGSRYVGKWRRRL